MSVRKRPDGRWQIDIVIRKGKERIRIRKSAKAANRSEALKAEATERSRLMAGAFVHGRSPFFSNFVVEFLASYASANNKPSERASKKMIFERHLCPVFGHLRLDEITAEHIERYKSDKLKQIVNKKNGKTMGPKTINNQLIALAKMFAVAKEWRRVSDPPRVRRMKAMAPQFDFLDFDESMRLLNAFDPAWRPMGLLGMRAGLRISEMLALEWDDIDLAAGRVVVRRTAWKDTIGSPKGGSAKEVPLSAAVVNALAKLPSRFAGKLVFPDSDGAIIERESCHRPLWRACKKAGLRRIGWHVLRHTFASHLVMRRVPLKAVQELMRHESITMTLRYAHLSPDMGRNAVDLLDGAPPAEISRDTIGSRP